MSADTDHVAAWVAAHALTPSDIDCATAVMLKILDGKCKMSEVDKLVMAALYDAVRDRPGQSWPRLFGQNFPVDKWSPAGVALSTVAVAEGPFRP